MEPLHEHNQKTYENICCMYGEGIQRVAVVQPTGSGKSILMAKLIEDNLNSRFFVLSTSHKINDQFKSKLDENMLERVECNIYCNMPNMKQEMMESLQPDYIFLDEMHRALAKEWSKGINVLLNMYPDAKILGLSATPIRYLDKCRNVANELFGGNLACDMSLSQAILDGILPMARYVCGVYSYEKDTESLNKKIEKSYNSDEEKKELLKELKILKENLDKGHGVSDIFRKYIMSGNEKFVVFLKNTTHLRVMKPVIEKWFLDAGFTVRLYEVHCKNIDRDKEFQAFKADTENGIKLCLSVNMLAEGIHGDVDGVIMLRETISANMYFQMIGRAFACGKKTIPLIFDLVANSQFISDASTLSFPSELRGEIEKRKEECEKEGKEYEVGFDVDEFIVMDEFMDVVSGFREIEGRLEGDWENGLKHFDKYVREHDGDVLVPSNYRDEDGFPIGSWVSCRRRDLNYKRLSKDRIFELEKRKFVWDVLKYNFENSVKEVAEYYKENGCYPPHSVGSTNVGNMYSFLGNEKFKIGKGNYPKWKIEIFKKYLPSFYREDILKGKYSKNKSSNRIIKNADDRFIYYAELYKKENGNIDIKWKDTINDYNIGYALHNLRKKYKCGDLSYNTIQRIEKMGIFLGNHYQKKFEEKMILVKQAVKEEFIVDSKNKYYCSTNLYGWLKDVVQKRYQKGDISDEQLYFIEKLVDKSLDDFFDSISVRR